MSIFLNYEPISGALAGGFRAMSTRQRGGAWVPIPAPTMPRSPAWLGPGKLIWISEDSPTVLRDSDGNVYPRGANWLYAGGGRWAASHVPRSGAVIYDGIGRTILKAGKHSVGRDGSMSYCTDYHQDRGVVVEDSNGIELPGSRNPNILCSHSVCIDRNAVVTYAAGDMKHVWHWDGTRWTRKRKAYASYEGEAVRWKGEIYLIYSSGPRGDEKAQGVYIHHIDDPTMGWKVGWYNSGQDAAYNPVGWVDPVTEQLWVAWSTNQGASLPSIQEREILGPPMRLPDTEPIPVPETVLKFGRPMFLGAYDTMKPLSTTPRLIGNVVFPDKERVSDAPLPLILAYDTLPYTEGKPWNDYNGIMNRTLYYYVHCGGSGISTGKPQWDRLMEEPEKPVILYLDSRSWPTTLPTWVNQDRVLLAVQAYPNPQEDVDEFKAAMKTMCDKVKALGLPMVLTPCFYDRGGTLTLAQILGHMPTYEWLMNAYPFVGIMPFSDQRADGMQKYPALYDVLLRWLNAIPARPNRYQWWTPSDDAEAKRALKDLVSYDLAGFSPDQRDTLHALIDGM